jgi:hypothetical protein
LIEQEVKSQYLLSYTPDKTDNDGGFHKVSISAGNKDYFVAAPEGFYTPEK